jgi:uncharacterized membrane-anchored protein
MSSSQAQTSSGIGSIITAFADNTTYYVTSNSTLKIDKDWVTDVTFDFSNQFDTVSSYLIYTVDNIILKGSKLSVNKVVARVSGNNLKLNTTLNCKVTSSLGEVRDIDLSLQFI